MANWTSLLNGLNSAVLGAFGREVTYRPQSGGEIPIRAIFQATQEAEENAPGVYGVVFVRLSDLPATPQRGDRVVVDSSVYSVFQIESDGGGGVTLSLRLE